MNKIDNNLDNNNVMIRKTTDFSIDSILKGNNNNIDCDNSRNSFVQKNTTTTATIVRPLNKIIASPWISSGPILYNPEYYANILNQQKGYFLQQNLIYVNKQNFLNNNCNNNNNNHNSFTIDSLINGSSCSSSSGSSSLKHKKSQYLLYENYKSITTSFNINNNKSNYSSNLITKHSYSDLGESIFCCKICNKVFECSVTLEAHEKVHRTPRYECEECGKGFSQLRNYKYHLSVHRGTKEFAAECPECGKMFNDKGYLSSHLKIHRNRKEYACPHCPKSFNQRVAFNMHVRIHTGVKPHKCAECGKRFSRKMLLKQHSRTHSGEKPYQCSVCGKTFADRSNMTLHHKLHSGIKPFACPICPKAFTKKHHLKTHINYHTGCKPYVCPHPSCGQAFTQSSNMRTHAKKCQLRPIIS